MLNTIPSPISFVLSAVITYFISSSIFNFVTIQSNVPLTTPYPNDNRYDPNTAREYFDQRLPLVLSRAITIAIQSLQFGIKVYLDTVSAKKSDTTTTTTTTLLSNEVEEQRGMELAQLLTKLGPTFIKVGQSLSIRTDLLSPAYIRGLATLQDQVPPFDTAIATQILEQEWSTKINNNNNNNNNNNEKIKLSDIIVGGSLSSKPIAAASLGQVYKATLKDSGETVAIKIQRPQILEQIALDMYLVREFGSILKRVLNLNTDTVGTVDAWGVGFINELDYISEATNAMLFNEQIQNTPLRSVVFSPKVIEQYTTRSVLVTTWIDGERLDKSNSNDVAVLCSIAMNTYLTMLLEFGTLHCDPHPGNLLRTYDGKLCILDWGMVTTLDRDLQLTLIEHMAHLTSADYGELPRDLLLLGFIAPSKANLIESSGIVDVLADIYGAWTAGGGAASIDVNKVITQLQDLTATNGNLFQIPPYFAYIAKSFSVLEGIGLSNQPGTYSIINECLPYISKRLLSDTDTMGPALSTFIFGPDKYDKDRIINYKRVRQLVEGFTQYTTTTSVPTGVSIPSSSSLPLESTVPASASFDTASATATGGSSSTSRVQQLDEITDQVLDLVFSVEDTPLQQIVLEQVAKIVSANGRYALTELRERSGILPTGRTVLGTLIDPLGLFRTSPLFRTNELDERTVEMTQQLVRLLDDIRQRQIQHEERKRQAQIKAGIPVEPLPTTTTNTPSSSSSFGLDLTRDESIELAQLLVRKVWERREGILFTSNRFVRTMLSLTADQLDRGERDTRRIQTVLQPSVTGPGSNDKQDFKQQVDIATEMDTSNDKQQLLLSQPVAMTSSIPSSMTSSSSTSSPRLDMARKLLENLSLDEASTSTISNGNFDNRVDENNNAIDLLVGDTAVEEFERFRRTHLE